MFANGCIYIYIYIYIYNFPPSCNTEKLNPDTTKIAIQSAKQRLIIALFDSKIAY